MQINLRNKVLQKIFRFHKWHQIPIEQRPYSVEVIKWCNQLLKKESEKGKSIIEIGCGLGDILAKIDTRKINKVGYDIDEKVIKAAKLLHPKIKFQVENFAPNIIEQEILILITVNFLYSLDSKTVEKQFHKIISNNNIKYIITEIMYPATQNYPYSHNMDTILGNDYICIKKRSFAAAEHSSRFILLYKRKEKEKV